MITLDQIGIRLTEGFSVFYAITESCAHTLGYLPQGKILPEEEAFALSDELHEERRIAQQWLANNVSGIRHEIIPVFRQVHNELAGYRMLPERGEKISGTELTKTLASLAAVTGRIEAKAGKLSEWMKQIHRLHDRAAAKAHYGTEPDEYSWQDVLDKLAKIQETGSRMTASWACVTEVVKGAGRDLEKARATASEIVREMFSDAAARQWDSALEIAEKLMEIR